MRLLLLDGATSDDAATIALAGRVASAAGARGAEVDHRPLRDTRVAWCQGCFECWTHTPGICKLDDAGRDIAEAYVRADAVVVVTRSRFGSLGFDAKKALDRMLGTLLPFFRRIDGEVHHLPRYEHPPALGVLAVLDAPDASIETVLEALVARNALNTAAPRHICRTLVAHAKAPVADAAVHDVLDVLLAGGAPPVAVRPTLDVTAGLPSDQPDPPGEPVTRVMLLVGSAKPTGTSTSESIASVWLDRFAAHDVQVERHHVHREAHSPEGLAKLTAAAAHTDLLIVATPLYFDGLPALVVAALEAILRDREAQAAPSPLAVAGLINCGFPEAHQCRVAGAMLHAFARRAGARWAGALLMGMGGAVNGRPLAETGGLLRHLPPALDAAARALALGHAMPTSAVEAFATPSMPTLGYVLAGDAGWLWTAAHHGALMRMWARPLEADGARDSRA